MTVFTKEVVVFYEIVVTSTEKVILSAKKVILYTEIVIAFSLKAISYIVEVIRIERMRKTSLLQVNTCKREVIAFFKGTKRDEVILRCIIVMLRSLDERATPIRDKVNRKVTKVNAFSVNTIGCGEEVNG